MDYEKEYDEVSKQSNWWKPPIGNHKVKLLSEMGDPYPSKKYEDKIQHNIEIEVDGEKKKFSMTESGSTGIYGQLIALGKKHKKLAGLEISIIVKMDEKQKREYTVPEAIDAQVEFKNNA